MVNNTWKKHVASDSSLGGSLPLLGSPESDPNAVLRWVTGREIRGRSPGLDLPGDAGYHSSFLVLPSLCCLSVSIGGGGPLQRLGVDMSFTPGRGTLGPIPGRRFQREKGLTQTSVSVLLGMKSEHKPVGRDLMVSAFFHSGTPTVKLLRFFFFF